MENTQDNPQSKDEAPPKWIVVELLIAIGCFLYAIYVRPAPYTFGRGCLVVVSMIGIMKVAEKDVFLSKSEWKKVSQERRRRCTLYSIICGLHCGVIFPYLLGTDGRLD